MQRLKTAAIAISILFTIPAFAKGGACRLSNVDALNKHLATHVSYPVKGKDLKQACKKEMPDEFSKADRACLESKIKNNVEYKSSDQVLAAVGAKK